MALVQGSPGPGPDPSALPASQCQTVADLERTFASLTRQDAAITTKLNDLLTVREDLNRSLSRLDLLRAHLGTQVVAARALSNDLLSTTASTATRVTTAVHALDIEQARVKATLSVVEQVAELKACVLGVTGSMGAPQDWETAAAYIHRASKIPAEIVRGEFAEMMVPTAEVPDPPIVTLENAKESLCGLFLREFEKAVGKGVEGGMVDGEKVTRFFKLFPLIGRGEVGLDVYAKYVCGGISSRARAVLAEGSAASAGGGGGTGAFFYANALTRLFEHIAGIVEQHSPLVERHYGKGKMERVVMRVQTEADTQGGIILDAWGEEREVDRKLTETKSYAFTFLVQSFLPGARGVAAGERGIQRTSSPAAHGGLSSQQQQQQQQQQENDGVDIKEIDMILLEIGAMLSRWSLYCRFMARKFQEMNDLPPDLPPPPLQIPPLVESSMLSTKISARLISPYQTLTTFFLRRSIEKAFQLEEPPPDLPPLPLTPLTPQNTLNFTKLPPLSAGSGGGYISSSVDDVMFIVDKILQRTLQTGQADLAIAVIAMVGRVLAGEWVGMVARRLRDEGGLRPATVGGGGPIAAGAVTGPIPFDTPLVQYLVLINNLDVAKTYLRRIVDGYTQPPPPPPSSSDPSGPENQQAKPQLGEDALPPLEHLFPIPSKTADAGHVRSSLNALLTAHLLPKTAETTTTALTQLFEKVVRPRIRNLVAEAWRDVDYSLLLHPTTTSSTSSTTSPTSSSSTHIPDKFRSLLYPLLYPFKLLLLDAPFSNLLTLAAKFLARQLEKKVIGVAQQGVREVEVIALERDVSGVVGVVVGLGRYDVREVFSRVVQVCLVLGMEEEEEDGEGGGGGEGGDGGWEWKLSREERRKVRGMVRR
ncbi:COG4 transport protein-domain-containing protein [Peziza echinospora]|nr:COG4 transport protein-domain-containing protein [Peziza echinospora]